MLPPWPRRRRPRARAPLTIPPRNSPLPPTHRLQAEAAAILSRATPRSLVLLDELGRGTSTADGLAIAGAAAARLAFGASPPVTLFVTHFPQLARALARDPRGGAAAAYVSFAAAGEGGGGEGGGGGGGGGAAPPQPEQQQQQVTFLYKLRPGVARSSFGLNVARLAGLPPGVLARAAALAAAAEEDAARAAAGAAARAAVAALRAGSVARAVEAARAALDV